MNCVNSSSNHIMILKLLLNSSSVHAQLGSQNSSAQYGYNQQTQTMYNIVISVLMCGGEIN